MELEKFLPNDKSILDELLNNNNEDKYFEGSLEDLLKLPTNEHYENNRERIQREKTYIKISDKNENENENNLD